MELKFKYIGKYSPNRRSIPIEWDETAQLAYVKDVAGLREMKEFLRNEMIEFPASLDIILGEIFKCPEESLQQHLNTLSRWIEHINKSMPPNLPC